MSLGALTFAAPWLLLAFVVLPVIWWLLRLTPPSPKRQSFPAIRLLRGLAPKEETPAHTPWWLIVLRLTVAALLILAVARPLLNAKPGLEDDGKPLLLVIDDGWSAAPHWQEHIVALDDILARAERQERSAAILTTAPLADGSPLKVSDLMTANEARARLKGLAPSPWSGNRAAAAKAIKDLPAGNGFTVIWASDGLESAGSSALSAALSVLGPVTVLADPAARVARLLRGLESDGNELVVTLERADDQGADGATVVAERGDGREVTRIPVTWEQGEASAEGRTELPLELRNAIERLRIEGEASAGANFLLDERWRRRPVGLAVEAGAGNNTPLLSEVFYIERALDPFAAVSTGDLASLLAQPLAVIVIPDRGALSDEDVAALDKFVREGGLVLRFAGPRLAENPDTLLPVKLRLGGRTLGGVMTWDTPATLAPFPSESPFAGLTIPPDVAIRRQVLAEPSLDLSEKTWARLSDGTPLVTAERREKGLLVLFHTTANTDWSDLALSGLFVELLRKSIAAAQGIAGAGEAALPPLELLDGFGHLGKPPVTAVSLPAGPATVLPSTPPGYYGNDSERRALNLTDSVPELAPLTDLPATFASQPYVAGEEQDLMPWLLIAAFVLLLVDFLAGLTLRGLLTGAGRSGALLALALLIPGFDPAKAQTSDDSFAILASQETRLAFIETGDATIDDISRAGLTGLTQVLMNRTSVDVLAPMGIDLARDEIVFFPLIYWPVTDSQPALDEAEAKKVNAYLAAGGTILFDLREPTGDVSVPGYQTSGTEALRALLAGVEVPSLMPLPPEHVLTKAFYLMQDFPGRYEGGALWVDAAESGQHDGVATVIIGSNDWAAAWAVGEEGRALYALVPGGERQREMAYRFGVNLVMYALTGNYKADQVHVPFILERLGQ